MCAVEVRNTAVHIRNGYSAAEHREKKPFDYRYVSDVLGTSQMLPVSGSRTFPGVD